MGVADGMGPRLVTPSRVTRASFGVYIPEYLGEDM